MGTCSAEVDNGALFERVIIHLIHGEGVVDGPDHQLVLSEGEEVLQEAKLSYRIKNRLHYEVAGK